MTDLSKLNPQQKDAVLKSIDHNVVLLAGAGSGKTATIVTRTQYLINDLGVSPSNIMLITFTNKAAGEIRDRVAKVCPDAHKMWIGTFHRICARIIRMFGDRLGIQNFSILDPTDAKKIIFDILEARGLEANRYAVNEIMARISAFKNDLVKPAKALSDPNVKQLHASIYQEYQNICWRRKSFDFDDIIIYAILLLNSYADIADWVHTNIKYVTADEAQDTNSSQFVLLKLLAGDNNIMLVGDVNQSIYAFRNAKPQYLEHFANTHPNAIKLKLEQNYRSTRTIIDAANAVVNRNKFGTKLQMFCENGQGVPIQCLEAPDSQLEAKWVVSEIIASKRPPSDFAIIYRANRQSRLLEEELTTAGVAYTIFGSQSFYSRKEVRDMLAYCKVVVNPTDVESFRRILKTVKGVGKVTVENIINYATINGIDFHHAIDAYIQNNGVRSNLVANRLIIISNVLKRQYISCSNIIETVLTYTDYRNDIAAVQSEETAEKLEILDEFRIMLNSVETKSPDASMADIIDQLSMLSDAKGAEKDNLNAVKLMTAHASKGLEFPVVFIVGAEEGSFPHVNAIRSTDDDAIEEERRLFYVAMTRAKERLYITRASMKANGTGEKSYARESRFLKEIPKSLKIKAF